MRARAGGRADGCRAETDKTNVATLRCTFHCPRKGTRISSRYNNLERRCASRAAGPDFSLIERRPVDSAGARAVRWRVSREIVIISRGDRRISTYRGREIMTICVGDSGYKGVILRGLIYT